MLNPKWAQEAKLQLSSRVAKIISITRGRCVVQCTDGRKIANVHFALGRVLPVETWVQIERVNQDWQVVGIGMSYTSTPITVEPPLPEVTIGQWMQSEGNPYLGQAGNFTIEFPIGVTVVLDLDGNVTEEYGMDRLLGCITQDGFLFAATYVANETLDGFSQLRIRGFSLQGESAELLWTVDQPVTLGTQAFGLFRANFFLDIDARVLTAAHAKLWSLHLNTDWLPDGEIVETAMDGKRAASIAGPYALVQSFEFLGKWRVLRRKDNLQWASIQDNIDVDAKLGEFKLNRAWPYVLSRNSWNLLHDPDTLTPALATVARNGSLTKSIIPVPDAAPLEITTLLEAAESQMSSEGTTGGQPYPYQENTWIDPPGGGDLANFDHISWGGRTTPAVDPLPLKVFVCPRNLGSTSASGYFRWIDGDEEAECVPCFCATSDDKLAYAAIEPKRILTYGSKVFGTLVSTGTIGAYHVFGKDGEGNDINDRWFINPPELVSFEEAEENGGYYLAVGPTDEILLNYEDYHRPQLVHGHRTVFRCLNGNGSIAFETDLSSGPFPPAKNFGDTVMTETLPWPENVYDIKVGPKGSGTDYEDAFFLVQSRRETRDAPASRPCFRFLSKTGTIRSTVMCSPGDTVEPSVIETEEEFTASEDNQTQFYLENRPAQEVIAFYVNDEEQDISNTDFNYLTDGLLWNSGVLCSEGDTIRIVYTYLENPGEAGQYEWAVEQVTLAANINAVDNCRWAVVGVYSRSIVSLDSRTDLFVLDLSNPDDVQIQDILTGSFGIALPRNNDFDRFVFTSTGVYWIGYYLDGYKLLKFSM